MILNIHSEALYLGAPQAKSQAAGHFYLMWLSQYKQSIKLDGQTSFLLFVAASATRVELDYLFVNAKRKNNQSYPKQNGKPWTIHTNPLE